MPSRDLESAVAHGHVMASLFGDAEPEPRLGRYRLRRLLGRGAHGRVFEAFDPHLDRVVAIKVAHDPEDPEDPEDPDDALRDSRDREARALARLSHPNVVEVYDVGVADGSLYVVMELIEGEDLGSLVARMRPEPTEIVALFVSAGCGLAAAHRVGLRHGDFKPSNVLVGSDVVKVADFGLAHLVSAPTTSEGTGQTLRHAGTPLYMAPEQLRGETVGPAADQYAFCVALWESICGAPPFDGATPIALLRHKERGIVGALPPNLPRGLSNLLRRGLAPEPGDRHASMDALLDALEREARPVRRAPIGIAAAVAVLVGGGAAASMQSSEPCDVASPWDVSRSLVLEESLSRFSASTTRAGLVGDVRRYGARWQSARDAVCEARARRAAMHCLESAALEMVATVDGLSGIDTDAALERYARPAIRQLPDPQSCLSRRRDAPAIADAGVVEALARARALQRLGQPERALEQARSAQARSVALDVDTQARARWELGRALAVVGRSDEAAEHLGEAFYAAKAAARYPIAVRAATMLADLSLENDELEASDAWLRHAEAVLEHIDDPILTTAVLNSRGNFFIATGRLEAARTALDEALALSDGDGFEAAPLFFTRARVHERLGDLAAAEADLRRGLAVDLESLGRDHPELIPTRAMLGIVLIQLGRYEDARTQIEAAYALGRTWLPPKSPAMARLHEGLGMIAQARGEPEIAVAEHRRGLEIRRAILPEGHPALASSHYHLGLAASARRRFSEAVAMYREALRTLEATDGPPLPEAAEVATELVRALIDAGLPAGEIEAAATRARALNEAQPGRLEAQSELDAELERWRGDPA